MSFHYILNISGRTARPWKMMVGRRSFPFGARPIFRRRTDRTVKLPGSWLVSEFHHVCLSRGLVYHPKKKHQLLKWWPVVITSRHKPSFLNFSPCSPCSVFITRQTRWLETLGPCFVWQSCGCSIGGRAF